MHETWKFPSAQFPCVLLFAAGDLLMMSLAESKAPKRKQGIFLVDQWYNYTGNWVITYIVYIHATPHLLPEQLYKKIY